MRLLVVSVLVVAGATLSLAFRAYSESCDGCNPNTHIESENDSSQCLTVSFGPGHTFTPGICPVTPPCDPSVPCLLQAEIIFKKGSSQVCTSLYGDICVVDPQGNENCSDGTRITHARSHEIPCDSDSKTTIVGKLKSFFGPDATLTLDFYCSDCLPTAGGGA